MPSARPAVSHRLQRCLGFQAKTVHPLQTSLNFESRPGNLVRRKFCNDLPPSSLPATLPSLSLFESRDGPPLPSQGISLLLIVVMLSLDSCFTLPSRLHIEANAPLLLTDSPSTTIFSARPFSPWIYILGSPFFFPPLTSRPL